MKKSAILLLSCPDRKGVVARVSGFIFEHGGNILHADEHGDHDSNTFLMRVEFDPAELSTSLAESVQVSRQLRKNSTFTGGSRSPTTAHAWRFSFRNTITVWSTCSIVTRAGNWPARFPASFPI